MLKKEEHEQAIQDIINALNKQGVDTTTISDLIQSIRENYSEIYDEHEKNTLELENAKKDIEEGKKTNLKLLLKLGKQSLNDDKEKSKNVSRETLNEDDEEVEKIDITKLADEMEDDI